MSLTEGERTDIVIQTARAVVAALNDFYPPRLTLALEAVGFLLERARPQIIESGSLEDRARLEALEEDFSRLARDVEQQAAELGFGQMPE